MHALAASLRHVEYWPIHLHLTALLCLGLSSFKSICISSLCFLDYDAT